MRSFDFAVVEQCFQYRACRAFLPFHPRAQGGVRGGIQHSPQALLPRARRLRFGAIFKRVALGAFRRTCPG